LENGNYKANENETKLKNEFYDIFPTKVSAEEDSLIEQLKKMQNCKHNLTLFIMVKGKKKKKIGKVACVKRNIFL
jgi:hypothetical protein